MSHTEASSPPSTTATSSMTTTRSQDPPGSVASSVSSISSGYHCRDDDEDVEQNGRGMRSVVKRSDRPTHVNCTSIITEEATSGVSRMEAPKIGTTNGPPPSTSSFEWNEHSTVNDPLATTDITPLSGSVDYKDQVQDDREHAPPPTAPTTTRNEQHAGLEYKNQMEEVRLEKAQPTDGSFQWTGGGSVSEEPAAVANAVLVHAVQIADDDGPRAGKDPLSAHPPPASMRTILVQIMVAALCLNTILATSIVVGAFCLAGACGRGGEPLALSMVVPVPSPIVTATPTLAPIATTTTAVPTLFPRPFTIMAQPGTTEAPAAGPLFQPFMGGGPSPPPDFFFPQSPPLLPPNPFTPIPPELEEPPLVPLAPPTTAAPSSAPTTPSASPDVTTTTKSDFFAHAATIPVLVVVAVIAEVFIVTGLLLWFRRWKQQQRQGQDNKPKGQTTGLDGTSSERRVRRNVSAAGNTTNTTTSTSATTSPTTASVVEKSEDDASSIMKTSFIDINV